MTDLVIGSGPAGVSVAKALLRRGRQVAMLDGGRTLEPAAAAWRAEMAAIPPENWSAEQRAAWQAPQFETPEGQVRRFGSDFAMEPGASVLSDPERFALRSSRAAGGLSNVWGSAVLPYSAADIAGWPITIDDLAPHYRAVAGFMPIAGRRDRLQDLFPVLSMEDGCALPASPQGGVLLQRIDARAEALARMSVHAGAARKAVEIGCRQCGMCLHGCPWGHIYGAGKTLDELRADPRFSYRSGAVARAFDEAGDSVAVTLETGEVLQADRLFVAAGVLETTRILLRSRPGAGSVELMDSQQFFLPNLHVWSAPRPVDRGPFHTLTQAFLEIDNPAVSPHLVHSQLYSWNAFYAREMSASYGARLPGSAPLFRALARRLIVAQGFLHSDHSARIGLRLTPDGRLSPTVHENPQTGSVMRAAKRVLSRAMRKLGLVALAPATRPGAPGSSFHIGGSVPMSADPRDGEADVLGRPLGLSRVHLVDASVLPAIPATTITFSVMANAHRIGALAP